MAITCFAITTGRFGPSRSPDCIAGRSEATLEGFLGVQSLVLGFFRRDGPLTLRLWERRRTRSQIASARVGSPMYSCQFSDAVGEQSDEQLGLRCPNLCEVEPDLWSAWSAIPAERELLKMCGSPVGPWLVRGEAREKWGTYIFTCLDNGTPPPPALCDCTPTACAAVAQSRNE